MDQATSSVVNDFKLELNDSDESMQIPEPHSECARLSFSHCFLARQARLYCVTATSRLFNTAIAVPYSEQASLYGAVSAPSLKNLRLEEAKGALKQFWGYQATPEQEDVIKDMLGYQHLVCMFDTCK